MIVTDFKLEDFEPWAGAIPTYQRVAEEGLLEELEDLISEMCPDGIDYMTLNDVFWFESDWIYESLGISEEE